VELETLDLSTLRTAFCSAEPIRASTVTRFIDRFAACGFRRAAFRPSYGLAEATVMVTAETADSGVRTRWCDERALRANRFVETHAGAADAVEVVSCGTPLGGQELVTVNEAAQRAADDEIGEVWLRGPSVAAGYWRNAEATNATFGARLADATGPYLRTGDLGWLSPAGELIVTGRKKDLIVVRGQNYYPQDLESAVEAAIADIRPGCVAAFSIDTELGECVVIAAELTASADVAKTRWPMLVAAVRATVSEKFELALNAVVFVERGTLPKTASGKIQRRRTRDEFVFGGLAVQHAWQARERDDDRQLARPAPLARTT
jgi:acyl-CoA synthetase (AMP-forming)/AMP-acid ligase II